MDRKNANAKISEWLIGSFINKLTYYITGWELSFENENYKVSSVFSEISILEPENWDNLIRKSPINLNETNEPEDTFCSIVLFTVINKYSISAIKIDKEKNLAIEFENNSKILIPSKNEIEDCTWILREEKGQQIKCEWGEIIFENY